tara:strand:+ start:6158 stop:9046 length:2889 start_codon:yes stop_codon:yes gene_type:complete
MSSSGYTQTILLDCNRLSSEEYNASKLSNINNAIFTNKVSSGITLDIGDQVSIESAHIAQRGAGGSVIEFRGETLGEINILKTETTNSSYIGYHYISSSSTYSPTGYAYESSVNTEKQIKIRDNEASMVIDYYKTTNGENNMTLPRNFGNCSHGGSVASGGPTSGNPNASFWETHDSYAMGAQTYYISSSHTFHPDYRVPGTFNACGASCVARRLKQDNSKYTLFRMTPIVWDIDSVSADTSKNYLQIEFDVKPPDPALNDFVRIRQEVPLSTSIGYNSPSTIASQITDELRKTETPINIIEDGGPILIESTLYKPFPCATWGTFNASTNRDFFDADLVDNLPVSRTTQNACNTAAAVKYLNNYAVVGFKRPDFVEAGREVSQGARLSASLLLASASTAVVETSLLWNKTTLLELKRFFDSQTNYAELLEYAAEASTGNTNYASFNTTSASLNASFRDEGRFIHLNVHTSYFNEQVLGNDMYNVSYSSATAVPARANASDKSSIPLFFYYNSKTASLTEEESTGDSYQNLVYGFARKNGSFISFTTELIGGIPDSYYGEQGGNLIGKDTLIGYDKHFNAYGNAAILLSSGFNQLQYYGHQAYKHAEIIRQIYVGANNSLFNFDTTESRFEMSNLHSAEKVGNFYNAGDPNPPNNILAPPPTAEGSQECYKINKALQYDSWTPEMNPYIPLDVTGSYTTGTQNSFIPMNGVLIPGLIYDAHGGISIVNMGVDDTNWNNSLWGILGFQYGQFNASGSIDDISNINVRFTDTTTNSSTITTNANITSQNSTQFSVNAFGTNLFNPLINDEIYYFDTAQKMSSLVLANASYYLNIPIVIQAESTKIKANLLPRKLLRGYFLINSDILDAANFYQLANPLQTMAMVGKYNAANDFVEYGGGGPVFTVTRKKTITQITSQILDPEGRTAQVGDNSGIIYRVDKQINTDLNFATNLMAGQYGKTPKSPN